MKRFKQVCLPLAAAAALLFLTACGGGGFGVQVLDESDVQPEYINFFSPKSMSGNDVSKYWIDRFTEAYNKQVYINFDSASYYAGEGLSYRELLEKRLESSAPDDLYVINAEDVLEFEKNGYWMDLSHMDFVEHLSEAALYQSTYNGKVFSVPLSFTGFGFAWNVSLLEAHGLSIPQNLEEFWTVCAQLKADGILPYGANKGSALTVPAMCAGLSDLYGSPDLAARIAALNSGRTAISTYLEEGYALLSQMIENGYLDPQQALEAAPGQEDVELFLSGGCAFICVGLGSLYSWNADFDIELTGLPLLADGCAAVYGANNRLCVNPDSRHLETTLQFIEMVGTPEALAKSAALNHLLSSAGDSDPAAFPGEEALVRLLQQPGQIPNQDFALHFNTWESIRNVARELCGGASVKEACAMLDEKQQADLAVYAGE